jgi:hypothetical protein
MSAAAPVTLDQALATLMAYLQQQQAAAAATASVPAPRPAPTPRQVVVAPAADASPSIFAPSPQVGGPVRQPRTGRVSRDAPLAGTKLTTSTVKLILQRVMYGFYRDHPDKYITKDAIYNAVLNDAETQMMVFTRDDKEKTWIPIKTALASGKGKGMFDHNGQVSSATGYRLNKDFYINNRV